MGIQGCKYMNHLQPLNKSFKYKNLIGTGGIGSGIFFKLHGNSTLSRNESRPGDILPFKDYCKLHIIIHYLSILLGSRPGKFEIFPIGKIGDDETGATLINEIKKAGIRVDTIKVIPDMKTLFSVCFQYPDCTGGNITTANDASSEVSKEDIISFFSNFPDSLFTPEIVLSVPEVPVETRIKLIEIGRARGSLNVVSLTSSEVEEFNKMDVFGNIDLIGLNIDEAKAISNLINKKHTGKVISNCIDFLTGKNPNIMILITDGPNGSYSYFNGGLEHTKILDVEVKNTAGAGDAFLAGIIAGICCGLPFLKGRTDKYFSETSIESSVELGSLIASISVMSGDTINYKIDVDYIREHVLKNKIILSKNFKKILG
jgi:sugar/nucleoside kinase (ribokinase family)